MRHFWQGFSTKTAAVQFKKHVIVLFWGGGADEAEARGAVRRLSSKYPSVKVKIVDVKKDPTRPIKHKISDFPTVVLMRDGREVDRVVAPRGESTLLEQLFRKAHT